MRKYIIIIPIIILMLIAACSKKSTEPETNLKLKISPSEQTIAVNDTATFSVKIEDATNLFGISVEIAFDSTKILLPDSIITIGEFWSGKDIISYSRIEQGCLSVGVTLTQTEHKDGIDGDGILFYFAVKGIDAGKSIITIENLSLIDDNGAPILGFDDIEITNGSLIIE